MYAKFLSQVEKNVQRINVEGFKDKTLKLTLQFF